MGKKNVVALLMLGGTVSRAWAELSPPLNEVDESLAVYRIQSGYNSGFALGTQGSGVAYGRMLNSWLELSSRFAFAIYNNTDQYPGSLRIDLTVGPTFNFPINDAGAVEAIFLTLGAGLNYSRLNSISIPGTDYATNAQAATSFAYDLELGKRFLVVANFSWKPSISVSGFIGNDLFNGGLVSYPNYRIIPLRFAYLF